MTSIQTCLVLGKPRFRDTDIQQVATNQGVLSAWQNAFERHKTEAPNTVAGDFAVAMQTAAGTVFMAVDRFAIRSLCYREVGGRLLFAERADELADASTEIDPQAIFDYFYFHAIPSPRTIFKGVYRVPPGHYVLFENGQLTVAPYWKPAFEEARNQPFEKLRDEFREILQQAAARQLDGGKAACFLSGGTDSSTVAGMIGLAHGAPAATYSIGFEAEGYDEMEFARIAARHFNTEHHEYYVTPDDLVSSIPMVASSYDQPFGNSSALPAYYCAKMAKEGGVSTILAGDGGDELFGGNSRYAKQRIFNSYRHLPSLLKKGLLEPLFSLPGMDQIPLVKKGSSYIEQASIPMPDRLQLYNLITRLGVDQVLTPGFLQSINLSAPLGLQREVWSSAMTCNLTNRELAFDWRFTLAESDLPKVCGTTRLAGINVGFPMLDDDLLAFSLRLPVEYKLKGLKLRWFFKEALRGFLPDEIIVKKKQGFGLPFGVWLTRHDALRKLARNSVMGLVDRGILRAEFVERLFSKHLQEHPGYYGEMIWISMMLEQWLQSHRAGYAIRNFN
ncbi:asparagine synthetase B family protein [Ferribacterium limneticum]|uniref:asparagine synthetase B family protein n=1 Tax=Ferribacterium limneticum TaxID=76259 RepID=UPI001CF8C1CA|nr:asparagine synthase C-terminal domain-containing protein [Ferribacterium limneticum]UCV26673.1 asparagine synthase [Ferribacterium limneticum]UCV30590.1 asparagine synthase [Ferribacterium limneticum]